MSWRFLEIARLDHNSCSFEWKIWNHHRSSLASRVKSSRWIYQGESSVWLSSALCCLLPASTSSSKQRMLPALHTNQLAFRFMVSLSLPLPLLTHIFIKRLWLYGNTHILALTYARNISCLYLLFTVIIIGLLTTFCMFEQVGGVVLYWYIWVLTIYFTIFSLERIFIKRFSFYSDFSSTRRKKTF